jgi:hypothetical protein
MVHQCSGIVSRSTASRAQFLSSAAASFFTSTAFVTATAEECKADTNKNPRYIQQELEMKYADGPDGNPRSRGVLVRRVSRLKKGSSSLAWRLTHAFCILF